MREFHQFDYTRLSVTLRIIGFTPLLRQNAVCETGFLSDYCIITDKKHDFLPIFRQIHVLQIYISATIFLKTAAFIVMRSTVQNIALLREYNKQKSCK